MWVLKRAGLVTGLIWSMAGPAQPQVSCLPIDRIDVTGVDLFEATEVRSWVSDFEEACLGLTEFDAILEIVTTAYVDAGFILSRAYLPEQDLSDGQLDIAVVEGTLSSVRINGEEQPRWTSVLFPNQIDRPVNLRDIEQGLDLIHAMPRWQAQMSFDAGDDPGESVLDISAQTSKRTEFAITSNNQGNQATGQWITGLSLDSAHLLGLNETWELGLTRSLSPGPQSFGYRGDLSRSAFFQVEFPYGRHAFEFSRTWSDYRLTIPGTISPIPTEGHTHGFGGQWRYLSFRDQEIKRHWTIDLDVVSAANFIQGFRIDASSRKLTSLKISHEHEGPLWGGQITRSLAFDKGLTWFGAEDARTQPTGAPDAQYARVLLEYDFERQFTLGGRKIDWTSTAKAQYSPDRLYGGQQFSIGSASSVRGSRIALARGSSGVLWRNDLALDVLDTSDALFGSVEAYVGTDFGRVLPQSELQVVGGTAFGQAIGLRATDGAAEFDVSYQRILDASSHLQQPDGEWMMSIGYKF